MRLSLLVLTPLVIALTGCAVGPDFERPAAPPDTSFDSAPLPAATTDEKDSFVQPQNFAANKDIPEQWWTLYHSKPLDQLIAKAITANPDLKAAEASLRVAQENSAAEFSLLFPTVSGSFSSNREKTSGASFGGTFPGSIYTLHNASVTASYGLDIFGESRRAIEEQQAIEDYQRFEVEGAYLTLTSNVVTAAVQEASLRGQITATKKIIDEQTRLLGLINQQLSAGSITRIVALQQESTLAQTKTTLPPLEKQLAQLRHQLSVYCGDTPSHDPQAIFELDSLDLPKDLPVSLPSQLVEQRPDVRAAEANLHAASAAIGVAEAARLPQLTLSANIGDVANKIGRMFMPGTGIWNLGAEATQTLFDAGRLAHEQGSAEAQYDVAAAQYRKTVLTAFQNVADSLRAIQDDTAELNFNISAERIASENLKLIRERFTAGAISSLDLVNAEVTQQQAIINRIKAEAQRYADTAALFQSLGGGWWNRSVKTDDLEAATQITPPKTAMTNDAVEVKPAATTQDGRHE